MMPQETCYLPIRICHLPPPLSPYMRKSTCSMVVCHALRCPLTDCSQWLAPAAMLSGGLIELLRFSRSSAVFTPARARPRIGSQSAD